MSYEHRSNVSIRGLSVPLKIVGGSAIVLFAIYFFAPHLFSSVFTFIVSPFWNLEKTVKTENIVVTVELQNSMITELQKENYELKSLMHRSSTSSDQVLAYILKKPPFSVYDIYIIDVGDNNVKIGDKVYAIGNVLLGEVAEVNGSTAKVKLYSSYGEKYNVLIGDSNIETTAIGQGGGYFEIVLPKDIKVHENDVVSVPDLNVSVFGIVKKVTIDSARAFSTVLFSQPVNIYEQKWVFLHTKK